MPELNVDLSELASVAANAANMARTTGAALPRQWVLPAGADPISAQTVPRLNAHAEGLFNGVVGVLNKVQQMAHHVGAAAVDYSRVDGNAAQRVAKAGGGQEMANPVPVVERMGYRRVPTQLSSMTSTTGDPLVFAQQLHSGPGPGPAHRFADSVRSFTGGAFTDVTSEMDRAGARLQHWTPVGSDAAQKFTKYRGWLDQLSEALNELADSADAYGHAFTKAKSKHPTPEEIIAARKQLARAMRSKDEVGVQAALAKFQEQNARSAETISGYTAETGATAAEEAGTATASNAAAAGSSGSGDSSMLAQMLPTLMSMMGMGMNGLPLNETLSDDDFDDYYDDYGLENYGIPSIGSSPAGGIPSIGDIGNTSVPNPSQVDGYSVSAMPLATSVGANTGLGAAPRAAAVEPVAASPGNSAGSRGPGMAGMPYMPMAPGMAGAGQGAGGGGERNRVVAWHPDRLMYVDDTPHTEPVIGERPTIAPTVTSPTPAPTNNQAPTRSGGSA
ncbi:PPE domain-containing protein [Nocardia paucivorans]|uniref:PPE domain-containing protein n=1 Tax=Nocardia paucivorans TaxID=114259 RepID=UPI0002F85CA1|nr:PPE domain-containing protein [Nocardia paucivorans]